MYDLKVPGNDAKLSDNRNYAGPRVLLSDPDEFLVEDLQYQVEHCYDPEIPVN